MELLAPAGNYEKMLTAFNYGADACYLAGKSFGLRSFAGNFTNAELKKAVTYAHSIHKKIYVTVNIIAHNSDFTGLVKYLKFLEQIDVDGVLVADIGILKLVKQNTNLTVHISTQANITNKYAAMEFVNMGAKRLVLARELSLKEIKEIKAFLPKDIEIECFVHGAMCISYSGRCLLSNFLTGRDGNRGACVQACRWNYYITEPNRPNDHYEMQEDERGTYILNSKDLNMIRHLKELKAAGVDSIKIEGRMKTVYYVATVVNAYRRALDGLNKPFDETLYTELEKTSHRFFTTGFYFGADDKEYILDSTPRKTHEFVAIVTKAGDGKQIVVEQRNRFVKGDVLEVLSPTSNFNKQIVINAMQDLNGQQVTDANKVQQVLIIPTDLKLSKGDMLRKKI